MIQVLPKQNSQLPAAGDEPFTVSRESKPLGSITFLV
jgi:hypothetical protein